MRASGQQQPELVSARSWLLLNRPLCDDHPSSLVIDVITLKSSSIQPISANTARIAAVLLGEQLIGTLTGDPFRANNEMPIFLVHFQLLITKTLFSSISFYPLPVPVRLNFLDFSN